MSLTDLPSISCEDLVPTASSPKSFNHSIYQESQFSPIQENISNNDMDYTSEALDLSKKPSSAQSSSLNDSCLTSGDDEHIDKMEFHKEFPLNVKRDEEDLEDLEEEAVEEEEEDYNKNESLNDSGLPHLDLPSSIHMPSHDGGFNIPRSLNPATMAFNSPLSHLRNTLNASSFFPQHHPQFNLGLPEQNMVCVECRKTFRFEKNFLRHMQKAHSTGEAESVLKCKLCNYTTKHYSNMYVHIRTHTGDKPYFCAGCGANFTQGSSLKLHIKSRHADKTGYFCLTKKPGKNNLTKLWTRVLKKDLHKFTNMHSNPIYPHTFNLMPPSVSLPLPDTMANQNGPLGGLPWQQGGQSIYSQAAANILAHHGFPPGSSAGHSFPSPHISPSQRTQRDIANLFPFNNMAQPRQAEGLSLNPFLNAHQMLLNQRGLPSVSPGNVFSSMEKMDAENSRRNALDSHPSMNSPADDPNSGSQLADNRSVSDINSEFSVIQKRLRGIIDQLQTQNPNLLSDTDPNLRRQLLSLLEMPSDSSNLAGTSSASHPMSVNEGNISAEASSSSGRPISPVKTPKLSDKSGTDADLKFDLNRSPPAGIAVSSNMSHFVLPPPGLYSPSTSTSKHSQLFQASPSGSSTSFTFPFPMNVNRAARPPPLHGHHSISPQGVSAHQSHLSMHPQFGAQALNGVLIPPMNLPFPPLHSSILRS